MRSASYLGLRQIEDELALAIFRYRKARHKMGRPIEKKIPDIITVPVGTRKKLEKLLANGGNGSH